MTKVTAVLFYPAVSAGSCKCLQAPVKNREMDWQLVASYITVKSTDSFYSLLIQIPVIYLIYSTLSIKKVKVKSRLSFEKYRQNSSTRCQVSRP